MSRKTRLAATFAIAAGLTAAGVGQAQTQPGSAAPPAALAQPAPLPAQSTPPWDQSETATVKPWVPDTSPPTYSVNPPPDSPSGIYLPAVVLGYAKSAAGCVVIGCDDGPQAGGSSGPPPSGSAEPPPASPVPSDRR